MYLFFNEKCLISEYNEPDIAISDLWAFISTIKGSKHTIFSNLCDIKAWFETFKDLFDYTQRRYFPSLISNFLEIEVSSFDNYYYLFTHQNISSGTIENVSNSSLAKAASKHLHGQFAVVIVLRNSFFSKRPHIPILVSPFQIEKKEQLINLPCFTNINNADYYLFIYKSRPFFKNENEFGYFLSQASNFFFNFDYNVWKPKEFVGSNRLKISNLFPLTKIKEMKDIFHELKIKGGKTTDTIAQYKELGNFVVIAHGYTRNNNLSSHYKRDIYEAGKGNSKLLISLDLENGGLEVIDGSTGTHIAVHGYGGEFIKKYTQKKDIEKHSLINLPKSMLLF